MIWNPSGYKLVYEVNNNVSFAIATYLNHPYKDDQRFGMCHTMPCVAICGIPDDGKIPASETSFIKNLFETIGNG